MPVSTDVRPAGISRLLTLAILVAACAPPNHGAKTDSGAAQSASSGTVFTDPALYRQLCLEADSGLTAKSGRCTPRDQGLRPPFTPRPDTGNP